MTDSASLGDRLRSVVQREHVASFVIVVAVVVLNLVQQPGLITFDTKLDLQFDPAGFLSRSLNLWNADSTVGGPQNQASGYLFPMGPAFWLSGLLGVPMWIWERLWSAAVMLIAYAGARRLAASWPGIGRWGAVVAGLAFMLAPRILLTVGGLSGETLPTAVLPWTLLPVVLYLRGTCGAARAFVLSAATVPVMGGQNATLVFACLVLPALMLVLVEGRGWRQRVRDLAAWGALVVLVSLWWVVPLLLLGSYAPPFLDFIESAHNTAGNIGWLTSVRGTGHWVAFFPGGGSAGWSGGYAVVSSAALLFTTAAVAAAGLAGLTTRGLWARRALVSAMLIGLAILTLGNGGWAGSLVSERWLDLLDGALAPLRNIHKFDPLIRIPLALGVGAFVSTTLPRLIGLADDWSRRRARAVQAGATGAVVLAVLAAAQPAAWGDLRVQDGMEDISAPWREAVHLLNDQQEGPVRALVLPGSGFAVQYWGRTLDEPIQVLDPPPWLARAQVTVAPAGTLRLLDSIEREVDQGRPSAGLADAFRRLGITHLVVRNDLDLGDSDAPTADVVYSALAGTEDLTSIGAFGGEDADHPDVEVFAVQGPPEPRLSIQRWTDHHVVQGGPEVVNELVSAGLVGTDEPVVLATDPDDQADILTDSNRRIERSFGRVHDALSAVKTPTEPFRLPRRVHDYTGEQIPDETTTAAYDGAALVSASTSQGYADIIGPVRPEQAPYAAFDRSALTAWTSAPFSKPVGQWIQGDFDEPREVGPLSLWFDTTSGADVESVRIDTDKETIDADVDADGRAINIEVSDGATERVRITVTAVGRGTAPVKLIDVALGDHEVTRRLLVPGHVDGDTSVYLGSEVLKRGCLVDGDRVSCDRGRANETPETAGFEREVDVRSPVRWRLEGRVVATHGPAVAELLAPIQRGQVSAAASSTFAGDPAVAASNAVDDRLDTSWFASPLDASPSLELRWQGERRIDHVLAELQDDHPGELPRAIVVDPHTRDQDVQLVATTGPDAGKMRPVRTDRLRIGVLEGTQLDDGFGISELDIGGLDDLKYTADPLARTGLVCGFGPRIEIAGYSVDTRVVGRIGDIVDGGELRLEACDDDPVYVGVGSQRIRVTNPSGFAVSRLWLEPADELAGGTAAAMRDQGTPLVRATSWTSTDRAVDVETEEEAVLTLPQSFNRGWTATLAGKQLEPIVIDGWKQAWMVPAGSSGPVLLHFEPQRVFKVSIVGGLVLAGVIVAAALVLLVLARVRPRRRAVDGPAGEGSRATPVNPTRRRASGVVGVVVLGLLSVPLAAGSVAGFFLRRSGPLVLPAVCGLGLAAAAVVAAWGTGTIVVPPPLADVITAAVIGAVVGAVVGAGPEAESES